VALDSYRRILAISFAIVATTACASAHKRAQQDFIVWDQALRLSATPPSSVLDAGRTIPFSFRLRNDGKKGIAACLGYAREVLAISDVRFPGRSIRANARLVDHPGCEEPFSLAPGSEFEWTEDVTIPDVMPGPGQLRISIAIVHPRACENRYGCYTTRIRTILKTEIR